MHQGNSTPVIPFRVFFGASRNDAVVFGLKVLWEVELE
jgi:hypothetical protein